jgi:hypothetical protein
MARYDYCRVILGVNSIGALSEAEGDSNKQIPRLCNITESSVKVHLKTILCKITVHNHTQAAIWAIAKGYHVMPESNHVPDAMYGVSDRPSQGRRPGTMVGPWALRFQANSSAAYKFADLTRGRVESRASARAVSEGQSFNLNSCTRPPLTKDAQHKYWIAKYVTTP